MNTEKIKQIKLQDFLAAMGCKPVKQYGVNLMYLSPLRTEKHASCKVNTELNLWYDFGIGKGGNIIDLAVLLYNSSDVSYLIHQIERNAPSCASVCQPIVKSTTPQNSFEHLKVLPLTHPALIQYLEKRCINIEMAKTVCKEMHFDIRGKHYFAIGLPNISGGYELRNPFFKGCMTPKDISHFCMGEQKNVCFLFEGFMDFLSFLTIRRRENNGLIRQDYMVLNSVANVRKSLERLSHYDKVQCFLDNDDAGRKAYQELLTELKIPVIDSSGLYADCKDLNEFLCRQDSLLQKPVREQRRGLNP